MTKRIHRVVAFAILVSVVFNGFLTACGNSGTSSKTESQKTSIDPNVVYNVIDSPFDRSGENGNSISSEMTEGSEMADDAQISDPSQASDTAKNSGRGALTDNIPSAEEYCLRKYQIQQHQRSRRQILCYLFGFRGAGTEGSVSFVQL